MYVSIYVYVCKYIYVCKHSGIMFSSLFTSTTAYCYMKSYYYKVFLWIMKFFCFVLFFIYLFYFAICKHSKNKWQPFHIGMWLNLCNSRSTTCGQRETAYTKSQSASEEATVLSRSHLTCNEKSKRQNDIRRK